MITSLIKPSFIFTGEKRLVYEGETPGALTEAELKSSTFLERSEALSLDDKDSPAEATADHPKVQEHVDKVDTKLTEAIKTAGIKTTSTAQEVLDKLKYQMLSLNKANIQSAGTAGKLNEAEKNSLKQSLGEFPDVITALNDANATASTVQVAVNALKPRVEEQVKHAQEELTAAIATLEAAEQVKRTAQSLAIDTIKEKQTLRFEDAKNDYIQKLTSALFPMEEDPELKKTLVATTFLEGLLSNAQFTHDPNEFDKIFDGCLAAQGNAGIKQYVESAVAGTEKTDPQVEAEMRKIFGDEYAKVPASARAYVHGLIASGNGNFVDWVAERVKGLPVIKDGTLKQALAGYHIEGITKMENEVGAKHKPALDQVNANPEVQTIYRDRMAAAMKYFARDEEYANANAQLYRNYFLAQVARMGTDDVARIQAIPSPEMYANNADTLPSLPAGARAAIKVAPPVTALAQRLAAKCNETNARPGTVFAFRAVDNNIFYAVYEGGNKMTIHADGNGPNMSADMPDQPAAAPDRTLMATPDTGAPRQKTAPGSTPPKKVEQSETNPRALGIQSLQRAADQFADPVDEKNLHISLSAAVHALPSDQLEAMKGDTYHVSAGSDRATKYTVSISSTGSITFGKVGEEPKPAEAAAAPKEQTETTQLRNSARGTVRSILGKRQSVEAMQTEINSSLTVAQKNALTTDDTGARRVFLQRRIVAGGTLTITAQINTNNQVSVTARTATLEETAKYERAAKARQDKKASA